MDSMQVAIQSTHRVHCPLRDLWRCLVGKRITDAHGVLVTFEGGDRKLLVRAQLDEEYDHGEDSGRRLAEWQLLMLPIGDGPERQHNTLLNMIRYRDQILTELGTLPARQAQRAQELRSKLAEIEARLATLPEDVFDQFLRVSSVLSMHERVKLALTQYCERTNWSPIDETQKTWMWAGMGTNCKSISEPWRLASDALRED